MVLQVMGLRCNSPAFDQPKTISSTGRLGDAWDNDLFGKSPHNVEVLIAIKTDTFWSTELPCYPPPKVLPHSGLSLRRK